jgi:hypothetical protein
MAFFSKTNVMIKFLHNIAYFRVKNANVLPNFLVKLFFFNYNICGFQVQLIVLLLLYAVKNIRGEKQVAKIVRLLFSQKITNQV